MEKDSVHTIDDVIHYVRCKMYFNLKKNRNSDENGDDSEAEESPEGGDSVKNDNEPPNGEKIEYNIERL